MPRPSDYLNLAKFAQMVRENDPKAPWWYVVFVHLSVSLMEGVLWIVVAMVLLALFWPS